MEENNVSVHEKWIAGLIWLALFGGLVFSSVHLGEIALTLNLSTLRDAFGLDFGGNLDTAELKTIDYVSAVFYGTGGLLLALAWWRFADLSHQLLVALATDASPFGILLFLPDDYLLERESAKSEEPLDLTRSNRSDVSIVVRYLGITWGLFVMGATLVPFLTKLLVTIFK
jgi:hypothetical protein